MSLSGKLADAVADRSLQVVGLLFGCAAAAHFAFWARAPDTTFDAAVAAGDVSAALPSAAAYAQSHPAYLLAFLAGALLLLRRP
ncbi:MAG: hypothetical protein ABEH83_12150 [Halobacterium sp.]